MEELPSGWLQDTTGDFVISDSPAHDVAQLEAAALHTDESAIPPTPDPVREVQLGTAEQPRPILLASWLWDHPLLLNQVIAFMQSFQDVFAWSYSDLEGIPPALGMHTIPLIENARPIRVRAHKSNPKYVETVKLKLEKLANAQIIVPVEHSKWLSPMVIAPKKQSNKIRVRIDFHTLNKSTIKDGFPMPFTKRVLEDVAGHAL